MANKMNKIKMIVLILVTIIFMTMLYVTFFKDKEPSQRKAISSKVISKPEKIVPAKTSPAKIAVAKKTDQPTENTILPFKEIITDIFTPSEFVKDILKTKSENPKPVAGPAKKAVETKKPAALTEQEKNNIRQNLRFKGSILANNKAVAIINGEFIRINEIINGYKVKSISEKQVKIDTGRGMIILEIITHE